jgi:hypothetical protein
LSAELLRTSRNPLFVRLRALLPAYDIDVARAVLADLFEDRRRCGASRARSGPSE